MEGYFTWQTLITYSGATLATTLLTQFVKDVKPFKLLPTRILSYFIALAIITASALAVHGADWRELAMAVINAAVVALASNGAFEAVRGKDKK